MCDRLKPIRVKLAGRARSITGGTNLSVQCPGNLPQWGNCLFESHPFARDYDWLVALDDLSPILPGRREELACPRANTILVTWEPSSVTRYGKAFAAQFGHVLTSQEETVLPHPNAIRSGGANFWMYGDSYANIHSDKPYPKTKLISTICSTKRQAYTMHARRYAFTQRLKARLPELEVFGRGVRAIEKKSEALNPYKFHLAVENHIAAHLWTEKLADAFLGFTVPIYCGCPNVFDYFPKGSVIPIDINDFEGSWETIRRALSAEGEYERRLEAVVEARRRVLEDYNLPAMLSRIIEGAPKQGPDAERGVIYTRRMMRVRHPAEFVRFASWRVQNFLHSAAATCRARLRGNRDAS